ncbi:cytochrome P450 steroid C27-monooxygenase [Nocardioides psychrotolerans]|uniref:Cholest-4-en-3-one 26-monooxygenase n=1 Tax=Nocardioides psychrotolerans TaxID=1005945 RepID=A0A1I3J5A5_9ACTN|nr:cytochrome P450 [Nocardioides psychrotolerans]GEP38273.1 cytochrome P450 steroid C27-monooxygenase [Nocardioides psychrotolerans]SFI55276.1 cholest-4-en-3-one 26-monooxygenase [Nocardioides psychrotolerans]
MTTTDVIPEGFDFTDPDVNWAAIPHDEFLALRQKAPVHWIEQPETSRHGMEGGTGYWAISKHADVSAISKDSKNFGTAENGAIIRFQEGMLREQVEIQRVMLINQDPPEHTSTRQIVSRGFTPRAINALEELMEQRAAQIVQDAVARGSGNFVEEVAAELPLQAIADLLGVPQEDRRKLFDWSNQMLANEDPDYAGEPDVAAAEILGYAMAMAADRKANPRDDIVTKLVHADKEGRGLTDDEFGFFVIILTVAGNETTRNAITHGMNAFLDNPDQWELWKKERPETMIDEVIRWATPVISFQRTAHHDVQVGDVTVKKGQRVGLFYASANFDDDVFEDPHRFDITRADNPHVAFGGHGAHYCIGANLARQEVRLIFNALADHAPDITKLEEPKRLRHGWINGIKELQVKYA